MGKKLINLTNQKFNRLTVLQFAFIRKGAYYWKCKCDCGVIKNIASDGLKRNRIKSCGCLRKELQKKLLTTHGMSLKDDKSRKPTKIYNTWKNMKARCSNPKDKSYYRYGGRGITICDKWLKFENFYKDMNEPPKRKTLDRINNDGNYEPSNCRWATYKEQRHNQS